jgi:hypothetical protein
MPVIEADPHARSGARAMVTREQDLDRRVLSLICRTTGRRRTLAERLLLDELVEELHGVRNARRDAARQS